MPSVNNAETASGESIMIKHVPRVNNAETDGGESIMRVPLMVKTRACTAGGEDIMRVSLMVEHMQTLLVAQVMFDWQWAKKCEFHDNPGNGNAWKWHGKQITCQATHKHQRTLGTQSAPHIADAMCDAHCVRNMRAQCAW